MRSRRVLIVEDDAEVRRALADAIRGAGAEVVVAADEADALAALGVGACPACVLLDLHAPRPDGPDLLRTLRGDPRFEHVPVITMSEGALAGDGAARPGGRPVDVDDLRRIVESLLDLAA